MIEIFALAATIAIVMGALLGILVIVLIAMREERKE